MPKTVKTPAAALNALMAEYNLNVHSLSKGIGLSPSAVRLLSIGKSKITVSTALRLGKFFGKTPSYWMDLQKEADLIEAGKDKKLAAAVNRIGKAKKNVAAPKVKAKTKAKIKSKVAAKPKKKTTLRDKRKTAAKKPGAKPAARTPAAKAKSAAAKKGTRKPAAKKAAKKAVRKPAASKKAVKKPVAAKKAVKKPAAKKTSARKPRAKKA